MTSKTCSDVTLPIHPAISCCKYELGAKKGTTGFRGIHEMKFIIHGFFDTHSSFIFNDKKKEER